VCPVIESTRGAPICPRETTMTDEASWLAAIRAAPLDDALRLSFAEWLDGHGDRAWAELIRVQIDLTHPERFDRGQRQVLRRREKQLLRANQKRLLARLPQLPNVTWRSDWDRGLVSHLGVNGVKTLQTHKEALLGATVVRALSLAEGDPNQIQEL